LFSPLAAKNSVPSTGLKTPVSVLPPTVPPTITPQRDDDLDPTLAQKAADVCVLWDTLEAQSKVSCKGDSRLTQFRESMNDVEKVLDLDLDDLFEGIREAAPTVYSAVEAIVGSSATDKKAKIDVAVAGLLKVRNQRSNAYALILSSLAYASRLHKDNMQLLQSAGMLYSGVLLTYI
jgi:hypothetical protein